MTPDCTLPAVALQGLRLYLQMGRSRSLRGVARQLGINGHLVVQWAREGRWIVRAAFFDREQELRHLQIQRAAELRERVNRLCFRV